MDPDYVRSLNLGAIWNFCEGFIVSKTLNQTPNIASTILSVQEKNQCITWFAKFKSTVVTVCMEGNLQVPNRFVTGLFSSRKTESVLKQNVIRMTTHFSTGCLTNKGIGILRIPSLTAICKLIHHKSRFKTG